MQEEETVRVRLSGVKDRLMKVGVFWVVFAGVAAYCYGSKRKITDIDVLVKGRDLDKAKTVLECIEGVDVVADLEIKTDQGICRFFVDDEMIRRTRWNQLFGVTIPVIPVEDNIIFKAILQRGENRGKHDVEDIKCMIKNEKMDLEYLQKRIQKYHAEERTKPLLKHLGIL